MTVDVVVKLSPSQVGPRIDSSKRDLYQVEHLTEMLRYVLL